jgi:glucokinase
MPAVSQDCGNGEFFPALGASEDGFGPIWPSRQITLRSSPRSGGDVTLCYHDTFPRKEARLIAALENSVLVFDIGGSHVAAAVCHRVEGAYRLGRVVSASHPAEQTCDAFVGLLHSLGVQASAGIGGILGAGLAMPGPFDYSTGVSLMRHKLPYLFGVNLHQALAARFGWQPSQVRSLNDAGAFLLGEIGAGAARGVTRAVGITLGTGIGSAFAVDGRVVTEGPGVPPGGEIWNLPYEGGIVEDLVSTRAIQGSYRRRTGKLADVAAIASAAAVDPAATEAFADFGRHLGQALRILLPAFAPEAAVLGGGITRSARLFLPAALHALEGLDFKVRIAELLDHAALVGAAVAWFDAFNGSAAHSAIHSQAQAV